MVINATPKSSTANSYVTRTRANIILTEERLYSDAWTAATGAKQDTAIAWATRLLDLCFDPMMGYLSDAHQSLLWPRGMVYDKSGRFLDQDVIPTFIEQATAELALELLRRDRTTEPDLLGLGIGRLRVGTIDVSVRDNMTIGLIPQSVVSLMSGYATLGEAGSSGNFRIVPLRRA